MAETALPLYKSFPANGSNTIVVSYSDGANANQAMIDYTARFISAISAMANIDSTLQQIKSNNEIIAVQSGRQANTLADIANTLTSNTGIIASSPFEAVTLIAQLNVWRDMLANNETLPNVTNTIVEYVNTQKGLIEQYIDRD